ncbi:MAG TPA: sigma-70 family RNA polymerase sigma factor [Actinomycetota bacterium]|nr:sigma-70 family RNA polymerase sigma factor [Actinomycetota bacterium]
MTPERVEEVYRQYRPALEAAAARVLRDSEEARDVVAETFVALLQHDLRDEGAAVGWLFKTVRNRSLNRLRDRRRALRTAASSLEQQDPAPESVEHPVSEAVRAAAAALTPRQAQALHLRFQQGLAYDEIAERMQISAGNARVIVHRAARAMRREAVRLLAEHHGAAASCRRSLIRSAASGEVGQHPGCAACAAVAAEVEALSARGVVPLLPPAVPASTLRARAQELWESGTQGVRSARETLRAQPILAARTAEILALALVTGVAAPAPPPVGALPVGAGAGAVAVAADASPPDAKPPALPQVVTSRTAEAARGPVSGLVQLGEGTRASDATGDQGFRTLLAPLGKVLSVPDPLETARRELDIRGLSISAMGDRAGRLVSLVFSLDLEAPPQPGSYYMFAWNYRDTSCNGAVTASLNDESGIKSTASSSCTDHTDIVRTHSEPLTEAQARVRGTTLEMELTLASAQGALARELRPGALLTALYATSSGGATTGFQADRAPDDRLLEYQVPPDSSR